MRGPGNATDADYEAHHEDPGYIYEGYLLFDFFITDRFGRAEVEFALDSSYHVLWWQHQRTPGPCDSPTRWHTVFAEETDPAYDQSVGPTEVGVYAEIERLCAGTTALPEGHYHCRFFLTEESFHQSGEYEGGWLSVMTCDTLSFDLGTLAAVERESVDRDWGETALRPNPSRGESVLDLRLENPGAVRATIYDVLGRRVRFLGERADARSHRWVWDGRDEWGRPVGPGVYLWCLESAGRRDQTLKTLIVR